MIDLRDLSAYRWSGSRLPGLLEAQGLRPGAHHRSSLLPPDRLVVIAAELLPEATEAHLAWLAEAASVLLLLEREDPQLDAELQELIDEEWAVLEARLGNVQARLYLDEPGSLGVALDRAMQLGPAGRPRPAPQPPGPHEWPAGPRLRLHGVLEPRNVLPRLCVPPIGPALLVGASLFPLSGADPTIPELGWPGLAVAPDGSRSLEQSGQLVCTSSGEILATLEGVRGFAVGLDPIHPVGVRGYRCTFTWCYVTDRAAARLCTSSHDWPCGHAKKLWGFKDNAPQVVSIAPDAGAYVSTFEHDALISSAVPLRWHLAEPLDATGPQQPRLAVAIWPPGDDPLRALFFCTGDVPCPPGDPLDPDQDDLRASAPVVVLGPDPACRYAVDLSLPTYRIRGSSVTRIDDDTGGYVIYDEAHRPIRRGSGRLLGGWFQLVTLEQDGQLWREDLATGHRRALGPTEPDLAWVAAIPGAANVALIGPDWIRLV